jgi:uracil-DNA glycosylase
VGEPAAGAASPDRLLLHPSWKAQVGDYLLRPDMQDLAAFLRAL